MKTILKLMFLFLILTSCTDDITYTPKQKHIIVEITVNSFMKTIPTCIRDGKTYTQILIDSTCYSMDEIRINHRDTTFQFRSEITVGDRTPSMDGIVYVININRTHSFRQIR